MGKRDLVDAYITKSAEFARPVNSIQDESPFARYTRVIVHQ